MNRKYLHMSQVAGLDDRHEIGSVIDAPEQLHCKLGVIERW